MCESREQAFAPAVRLGAKTQMNTAAGSQPCSARSQWLSPVCHVTAGPIEYPPCTDILLLVHKPLHSKRKN